MNTPLQNDLLTALGTCSFLDGLQETDTRLQLEQEIIHFLITAKADPDKIQTFIDTHLLDKDLLSSNIQAPFSQAAFMAQGSQLLSDFRKADAYFQSLDPSFGPQNEQLLASLYQHLCDFFSIDQPWTRQWTTFDPQNQAAPSDPTSASWHKQEALKQSLQKLDELTGLPGVKSEVRDLCALLEISRLRTQHQLRTLPIARHLIFSGNPGTGKTTTARILADIYRQLGFLSKGQLIECSRPDLVGEYIGHSAQKTKKVIEKAKGGILFIDEAYALAVDSPNDFGKEAIEVLLKEMEDNRDDLVVIAAGYPDLMDHFLSSNPGLRSRFTTTIHFENYTAKELLEILEGMAHGSDYQIDKTARKRLLPCLEAITQNPPQDFANARMVRSLLEKAITNQARRLLEGSHINHEDLVHLTWEDFEPLLCTSRTDGKS